MTERKKHKLKEDKFKQTSELLQRERDLDEDTYDHMRMLFWEFGSMRKPGSSGVEPFDPVRIESHLRLSGMELTKWEYNLLMEMDLMFRSTIMARR